MKKILDIQSKTKVSQSHTTCCKCKNRGHLAIACLKSKENLKVEHNQAENNHFYESEQQPYEINKVSDKLRDVR